MLKAKLAMLLTGCALPFALASCQGGLDTDIFFSETISDLDEKAQDYHYLVENCDPKKSLVMKASDSNEYMRTISYENEAKEALLALTQIQPVVVDSCLKEISFIRDPRPYSFKSRVPSSYSFLLDFYIDGNQNPVMNLAICNVTDNHWAVCFRKCVYSITVEEYERVASAIDSIFENFNISASDGSAKQDGRWSPSDQSEFRWKGALPC